MLKSGARNEIFRFAFIFLKTVLTAGYAIIHVQGENSGVDMTKRGKYKSKRGFKTVISLAVLVVGFVIILIGVNVYGYFRTKTHFATTVITDINKTEVEKLRDFFDQINDKLLVIHDLGENGELNPDDIVSLNKKFFPFLSNNKTFSGLILADDRGNEYFLYRKEGRWITRTTSVIGREAIMVFQQWEKPDDPIKRWEKKASYDPRKRPWFHESLAKREVHWTPIYKFYESGQPGVTASISWKKPGNGSGFMLLGLDIPLKHLQEILALSQKRREGILFLVNPQKNYFVTGQETGVLDGKAKPSDHLQLLQNVVKKWKGKKEPSDTFITIILKGQKWLASFRPLFENKKVIWVGYMAPERVLLSDLRKTLFDIDLTDVMVALVGGILLSLLFLKTGGFRRTTEEALPDPVVRLHQYINEGEGSRVEFKSTVRTNLKTGKKGKEIEFAWLKALAAFLNSDGGAILIGVNDNGEIVGIEADNFENHDRCLLHIKNLINQHVGAEFSAFIQVSLVESEDKTVVMIECAPANEPVFFKIGKNEEFYIRSGPSSVKLSPSQMMSYVLQNMKKGR